MALPGNLTPPRGSRDDLRPKNRACGPVGLRNAPAGAVQASSPTEVCCNGGPRFPGWPRYSPSSVGADSISARRDLRRRGVPGPIWNRPLQRFAIPQKARFPGWYGPSVGRRGGIYPARGRLRRRGGAGRCEHRPLQRFAVRQGCRFPAGRGPSVDRRGGIYPARGRLCRRGVRRDEGIPPYGRPGGRGRPGLAGRFPWFVGEGHGPPGKPYATAGFPGRSPA